MRWLKVALLVSVLLPNLAQAADEDLWEKKLPFKIATIEYALNGVEKGQETLYIKDYGTYTAKYHNGTMSMMGMKVATQSLEITDPDWVYTYDLKEGKGSKATNPQKIMKAEYDKLTDAERKQVNENAEKLAVNFLQGGGGSIEKNVTEMFGFKVDRATVMGIESYTIADTPIALQTSGSMMGIKIDSKATSFNTSAVDNKFFQHPANIQAEHNVQAEDMTRAMAEKTMAWLKDPEAETKAPPTPGFSDISGSQNQQQGAPQEQPEDMDATTEKVIEGVFKSLFGK